MYYCNNCDTEISDECIEFSDKRGQDQCPYCESSDVDYFHCEIPEGAKNTEQQVQPDNAEKYVPFGYYPNNEFEE